MPDYTNFRQRLDTVLRTLDIHQVSAFLIAEGQWQPGATSDPEFAMWMMIAGSPTLSDLHPQARAWLLSHGHESEANALLQKGSKSGGKQNRPGEKKRGTASSAKKLSRNNGYQRKE